jgi:hypothetical protein
VESPVLQDDAVVSVLQEAAAAAAAGKGIGGEGGADDSAAAGVRLIVAARSLALLTMLRGSLRSGAAPPLEVPAAPHAPPDGLRGHLRDPGAAAAALGAPAPLLVKTMADLEIREGSEVALPVEDQDSEGGGDGDPPPPALIPCRVAFEAGVERSVQLTVASRSHGACVSASMLLVETIAANAGEDQRLGIVRAVAPLAGCSAAVDQSHKKWLHVRVRSPFSCLAAVARSPPAHLIPGGGGKGGAAARRRLQDGHWTLAFADEETCAAAKQMVDARAVLLRRACGVALQPMTGA